MTAAVLVLAQSQQAGDDYAVRRDFSPPTREVKLSAELAGGRAFFGAPPPVPHFLLSERSSRYCLQCHALENRIEKRQQAIAPVPHAEFSECMQCHVAGNDPSVTPFRENDFLGLDFPGKGSRANDYAPPTIPHKTYMRENCLSCHGVTGDFAIKSPHPIRSQCGQCHAPEAAQDYTRPAQ